MLSVRSLSYSRWLLALTRAAVAVGAAGFGRQPIAIQEQITFLYYKDIEEADRFFSGTLELSKSMDSNWVKLYRVSNGASLGAVQEGRGFLKAAADKPVMVSWVVSDAKEWFGRLSRKGVKIVKPLSTSQDPPIQNFIFEDPAGYTFEILNWRRP